MAEPASSLVLSAEDLADLCLTLRSEGFKIAPQQGVWAQQLLLRQAHEGRRPATVAELSAQLGPIFCRNREQQVRFPQLLAEWLHFHGFAVDRPPAPLPPPARLVDPHRARRLWRIRRWVAVACLGAAALAWAVDHWRPRTLPGWVKSAGRVVPRANVSFGAEKFDTGQDGRFQITYSKADRGALVTISKAGFDPISRAIEIPAPAQLGFELVETKPVDPLVVPPPVELPPAAVADLKLELLREIKVPRRINWLGGAAALLPFGLFALWRLWRRRPVLQRQLSTTPTKLREVALAGGIRNLLPGLGVRQLARELRRRRMVPSRELNIPGTIAATLRHAGFFTPVYGSYVEPDYLVLIDRSGLADHQARLAWEIVRTLALGDVAVEVFWFDHGCGGCRWQPLPRRLDTSASGEELARWESRTGAVSLKLDELVTRYPEHRVLFFTAGEGFFGGFTGAPAPWLAVLDQWAQRVVITPEPRAAWGAREWAIERLGFAIVPLSRAGVAAVGEFFQREHQSVVAPAEAATAEPPAFAANELRWLERDPPPAEASADLCRSLEGYLGPAGFEWLAACALYPEVHWGLTLRLGAQLVGETPEYERLLPRLSRLVWLRRGYLPDWLRQALLARLPAKRQFALRRMLLTMLEEATDPTNAGIPLRIAVERRRGFPGLSARLWQRACRYLRGGRVQDFARRADAASPLSDYVFLRYVAGHASAALAVEAPSRLARLLFPRGLRILGVRPVLVGLPVCLLSLLLLGVVVRPAGSSSLAFRADGRLLATGGPDERVRLWDPDTGKLLFTLKGHTGRVTSVAFSRAGSLLASGSEDQTVRLWDSNSGRPLRKLAGQTVVTSVAFSPKGDLLASGCGDMAVRLWDPLSGELIHRFEGHSGTVTGVSFDRTGAWLASSSYDHTVRIWDVGTGVLRHTLTGHGAVVACVAFDRAGPTLASGDWETTVRLWDPETGQPIRALERARYAVQSLAWDSSGQLIVAGGIEATLWDRASGRLLQTTMGGSEVALDGDHTLATSSWSGSVELWRLAFSVVPAAALKRQIQPLASVLTANGAMIRILLNSTNGTARAAEASLPAELPLQIRSAGRSVSAVFRPETPSTASTMIAAGESLRTTYQGMLPPDLEGAVVFDASGIGAGEFTVQVVVPPANARTAIEIGPSPPPAPTTTANDTAPVVATTRSEGTTPNASTTPNAASVPAGEQRQGAPASDAPPLSPQNPDERPAEVKPETEGKPQAPVAPTNAKVSISAS